MRRLRNAQFCVWTPKITKQKLWRLQWQWSWLTRKRKKTTVHKTSVSTALSKWRHRWARHWRPRTTVALLMLRLTPTKTQVANQTSSIDSKSTVRCPWIPSSKNWAAKTQIETTLSLISAVSKIFVKKQAILTLKRVMWRLRMAWLRPIRCCTTSWLHTRSELLKQIRKGRRELQKTSILQAA